LKLADLIYDKLEQSEVLLEKYKNCLLAKILILKNFLIDVNQF
jgi:hypothetical protein